MFRPLQRFKRIVLGSPLRNEDMHHELLPKWKALAVLSSDALSSVAYATEEILLALIAFGTLAFNYSLPIGIGILILLILVTLSYRQTIESYPNGGGAYIVAKENLGQTAGLVAGASLLIDYTLTVSVSVASGVENIASAIPGLQEHMVLVGVVVIAILMLLSLRGIGESATVLALPTYAFIFSILAMIGAGLYQTHFGNASPVQEIKSQVYPELALFVILRAFASGCSALTGVEAISNGVPLFKSPAQNNAKTTLTWMAVLLGLMFAGVTYLAHIMHLTPSPDQTLISNLASRIFGNSVFYYLTQTSTALILFLAAGTSYADFPRLAGLLAKDRYAPRQLAAVGDKLVFSNGVIGLSVTAALLLVIFGGRTHHLIPLYAVGVFLSFTLSQAGMVVHHLKLKEKGWRLSLVLNFIGMLTTAVVLTVIILSKFTQGAWMVILLIPANVLWFKRIHHHYLALGKELNALDLTCDAILSQVKNRVIIPISSMHRGVVQALQYGQTISKEVEICIVETDSAAVERVRNRLQELAPQTKLTVLPSPFRSVLGPLVEHIETIQRLSPDDYVTVLIPEFVTKKWYHQFLHNQTAFFIRTALIGQKRVIVSSMRYYLKTT
jgi:amino acid transporter